ncbi:MAG: epoxyqueuosine reductase QueH [Deltaproteobacteria bacterium]|nr:epoxyqueuosine reductase QueH [Deltaproteobacteria bacterium]
MSGSMPKLLVHACCAPCATVPLARLLERYSLVFYFFGPNIQPQAEYQRRLDEMRRFCDLAQVVLLEAEYQPEIWRQKVGPFLHQAEGSFTERCQSCYRLRMEGTARRAVADGFDAFTVTLSLSRHKNSKVLAEIGQQVGRQFGVEYLAEDFKKRDGFKTSVLRSKELALYRQDYCGCLPSLREAEMRRQRKLAVTG